MKKILITPLDWGLGHATRCIPVIRNFTRRQHKVLVAGSGQSLELLKEEFPALRTFVLPSYSPQYPSKGSRMIAKMILQLPKFTRTISEEHDEVERIVERERIDIVISDNRYGCWSSRATSIFVTHQSNIQMPKRFGWLAGIVRKRNEELIKNFSRCWIPDFRDGQSVAGELTSFEKFNTKIESDYIGMLSRFSNAKKQLPVGSAFTYKCLAIFSGPEPQRSILEKIVTEQLEKANFPYFVVRGIISSTPTRNATSADYLISDELEEKIRQSEIIIARSGYSTIMDLCALQKKAIFIPTPGQTEQEYLAKKLKESGVADYQEQEKFSLQRALVDAQKFSGLSNVGTDDQLLDQAIDRLLS